jgi:hypothetical protein
MDPSLVAAQPSGLEAWLTANQAMLSLVQFASQIIFWVGMLVLLAYAVAQYKRWVNFQLGTGRSGKLRNPEAGDVAATDTAKSEAVDVEAFVE